MGWGLCLFDGIHVMNYCNSCLLMLCKSRHVCKFRCTHTCHTHTHTHTHTCVYIYIYIHTHHALQICTVNSAVFLTNDCSVSEQLLQILDLVGQVQSHLSIWDYDRPGPVGKVDNNYIADIAIIKCWMLCCEPRFLVNFDYFSCTNYHATMPGFANSNSVAQDKTYYHRLL